MFFESLELRRLLATNLLIDAAGLSATNSVTVDGVSYFFADNGGGTGKELWKSDGTISGTTLVKDLTPGVAGSELHAIHQGADGHAVFVTVVRNDSENGMPRDDYTLWTSDGTAGGTVKLKEFKASMNFLTRQLGDRVIIFNNTESATLPSTWEATYADGHLYATDGTAANTKEIKTWLATPATGSKPALGYMALALYDGKDRVIFGIGDAPHLWSTDGTTAGTIDVSAPGMIDTASEAGVGLDLSYLIQLDGGRVLIPKRLDSTFWIADGTLGGTKLVDATVPGTVLPLTDGSSTVVNGKYVFWEQFNPGDSEHILPLRKIVHALDVETGEMTDLYAVEDDGGSHWIRIYQVGSRAIFIDHSTADNADGNEDFQTKVYSTDGTAAGTIQLEAFDGWLPIDKPTTIGSTAFFVVTRMNAFKADTEALGWISGFNWHPVIEPGLSSLELWRTDGTVANTGKVKTIWQGDATGLAVGASLSQADGKLLVRTQIHSGAGKEYDPAKLPLVFDDTSAYDDKELTFGREGASARLVNGVLKVNGSFNNDRIRVWRSQRMPEKLIVEYNGNERSFIFNDITRINVDLQDGNDYFQILEGEGQVIRTRTSILGGDGSDTIFGGTGRDTIYGGNSGDLIYGRGNADVILAGGGRDRVNAGVGDDQISGGSGIDRIIGGAGVDVLFGQNAVEYAFGKDIEGQQIGDDVFLG